VKKGTNTKQTEVNKEWKRKEGRKKEENERNIVGRDRKLKKNSKVDKYCCFKIKSY